MELLNLRMRVEAIEKRLGLAPQAPVAPAAAALVPEDGSPADSEVTTKPKGKKSE